MAGLAEFMSEDVIRKGQQQGYYGTMQRAMATTDVLDADDQKTLAVVRRFLAVEDGWEQLVSGGAVQQGALAQLATSTEVHTVVVPSPHTSSLGIEEAAPAAEEASEEATEVSA